MEKLSSPQEPSFKLVGVQLTNSWFTPKHPAAACFEHIHFGHFFSCLLGAQPIRPYAFDRVSPKADRTLMLKKNPANTFFRKPRWHLRKR